MSEKIFISYNHTDSQIVDIISRRLELEFGRNNIFYDAWSIQPGDSIIGKMNEGLENFTTFFFFISPNSLKSKMVSLEWQTALNRAVNNNLKFIAVRIADCNPPTILSDKLYIDLYGQGLDDAIGKMKCIIKSKSTYKPMEDAQNLIAKISQKNEKILSITIEAQMYAEPNPTFAFACTNSFDEFSICFNISENSTFSGKDTLTDENKITFNARTVQLQRALKPNFPFVFEVTLVNKMKLDNINIYVLTDASKCIYESIPMLDLSVKNRGENKCQTSTIKKNALSRT